MVQGLEFRVQGLGPRIQGLGIGGLGLEFGVEGLGFRYGFRVSGDRGYVECDARYSVAGIQAQNLFRISDFGFRV